MTTLRSAPTLPADQASRLRALVDSMRVRVDAAPGLVEPQPSIAPERRTPVVCITSGKGGVGKTNLCVNLSIALAKKGLRTTLLDADLGMANADVLCGLSPARRLERVVGFAGPRSDSPDAPRAGLCDIAVDAPGGFRLVPGAVGVARMADLSDRERDIILNGLSELDATSDAIVIDTGAGASPGVTTFARAADLTLVIATPEPTSIADAYGMVKCLLLGPGADARTRDSIRIELVINQARDEGEARAVHTRISGVAERFLRYPVPMLAWIPPDPALPAAVRARRPLMIDSPRSPAAIAVDRFASRALDRLGIRSPCVTTRRASWFGRVSSLLAGSVAPTAAPQVPGR